MGSTSWRAVRALGLTVKKTVRPSEHDRPDVAAARVAWHAAAPTWDVAHLVFLDETGITNNLLRRYGRAPRGARVHDHAPCGRRQTSTFLAALRVTGLTAPGVFDGAIDGESFRAYIEQILVPTLQPGDIVIADTTSGPTRSPASSRPSRPPGPHSGTCHPIAQTSIPSSSASRSSRPSFAPLAVAAPRRSGRSSASAWRTSALTNAATIFGTAGTRPPHGHEKRFNVALRDAVVAANHFVPVLHKADAAAELDAAADAFYNERIKEVSVTQWVQRRIPVLLLGRGLWIDASMAGVRGLSSWGLLQWFVDARIRRPNPLIDGLSEIRLRV